MAFDRLPVLRCTDPEPVAGFAVQSAGAGATAFRRRFKNGWSRLPALRSVASVLLPDVSPRNCRIDFQLIKLLGRDSMVFHEFAQFDSCPKRLAHVFPLPGLPYNSNPCNFRRISTALDR